MYRTYSTLCSQSDFNFIRRLKEAGIAGEYMVRSLHLLVQKDYK